MIAPRALAEFIQTKKSLAGNASNGELPSEEDVRRKLEDHAEQLKETAVYKRVSSILCKPVYPFTRLPKVQETSAPDEVSREVQEMIDQLEEAKNTIVDVYDNQSEHIEKVWASRKLDIVPGDILLDSVCSEYSVRFKKERDSTRLAALMKADEIDEQLKSIIDEIGS